MNKMIDKYGLKISSTLFDFINNEAIPGIEIKIEDFGKVFCVVHELSPINKKLIEKEKAFKRR